MLLCWGWHRPGTGLNFPVIYFVSCAQFFFVKNSFQQIFDNFVIGLAALRYWPGATRCQHLTNFALKQATRTSRWPVRQLTWPSLSLIMKNTWYYSRRLLRRLWIDGGDASSQQYIRWNYTSLLLGWWNIHDLYRGQNTIPTPLLTIHQTKLAVYSVHITMTTNVSRWVWRL